MIIRCQAGTLIESDYVMHWDKVPVELDAEPDAPADTYHVVAKMIDGTSTIVFTGTEPDCDGRLEEIDATVAAGRNEFRSLYDALLRRTDKLDSAIQRVIAVTKRSG